MYIVKIESKDKDVEFSKIYFDDFTKAAKCFLDNEKLGLKCSLYMD